MVLGGFSLAAACGIVGALATSPPPESKAPDEVTLDVGLASDALTVPEVPTSTTPPITIINRIYVPVPASQLEEAGASGDPSVAGGSPGSGGGSTGGSTGGSSGGSAAASSRGPVSGGSGAAASSGSPTASGATSSASPSAPAPTSPAPAATTPAPKPTTPPTTAARSQAS